MGLVKYSLLTVINNLELVDTEDYHTTSRLYILRDYHDFAQISRILVTTSTRGNHPLPFYEYVVKLFVLVKIKALF